MTSAAREGLQVVTRPPQLPGARNRVRSLVAAGAALAIVVLFVALTWYSFQQRGPRKPGPQAVADTTIPKEVDSGKPEVKPRVAEALSLKLRPMEERDVAKGGQLRFTVPFEASAELEGQLTFRLGSNAPPGATIDPKTGVFTWTPPVGQSPGSYQATVEVSAPGDLHAAGSLHLNLVKVNHAPAIQAIEDPTVEAGKTLSLQIEANDPDQDRLNFSSPEKPQGASLDATGRFEWTPGDDDVGKPHKVIVRVTDDGPGALSAEKAFTVTVAAKRPASDVAPPVAMGFDGASGAGFQFTFPSGKSLRSADFEILQEVKNQAKDLLDGFLGERHDVVGLYANAGRNSLDALCRCSTRRISPEGPVVAFHRDKDPMTCYSKRFDGSSFSRRLPSMRRQKGDASPANRGFSPPAADLEGAVPNPGQFGLRRPMRPTRDGAYWEDVVPSLFVTYDRAAKWQGWLATWNERGQKHFWCQYSAGERDGFCCLFKEDLPRMVLECSQGTVGAVHLIAGSHVQTFASVVQAAKNSEADSVLKELTGVEAGLRGNEKKFKENVRKAIRARIAGIHEGEHR